MPPILLAVLGLLSACSGADDSGSDASAPDPTTTVSTTTVPSSTTGGAPATTTTTVATTTTATPLRDRALAVEVQRPDDLPGRNVYGPADLDAVVDPLPVIVWGNGGCFRHDATWRPLFERWAGAGFLVVTIAAADPPVEGEPAAGDQHTVDDQAAGIDWVLEQHTTIGGPYEGRIDTERIVAAGNSCGGITALALAGRDPRVAAVFVLSGSSVPPGGSREGAAAVMGTVSVPVGYVVGGPEDLAAAMAAQDLDVLPEGVAGFVAARRSGDHVLVSTDPEILADVADIGLEWLDYALYGTPSARDALVTVPCGGCEDGLWATTTRDLDAPG